MHALGYAGILEQLVECLGALWDVRGVLREHDVASHKLRGHHARRLIEGEIPRLDAVDHADRLVDECAFAFFRVVLLRGQNPSSFFGVVVEDLGAKVNLRACIADFFAHLQRHNRRQFFSPLAN